MSKLVSFESAYRGEEDENRFVCIDGYPEDENAPGEVIAMVWQTPHGDFVVDWHDNAYRGNETVEMLIEEGKQDLASDRYEHFMDSYAAYDHAHGQLSMTPNCIYGIRDKVRGESGYDGKAYDAVASIEYNHDKEYRIIYHDPYLEYNEDIQKAAEEYMASLDERVRVGAVPKQLNSNQFVFENHRELYHSYGGKALDIRIGMIDAITERGRRETVATVQAASRTDYEVQYDNPYFEGSAVIEQEIKSLIGEMFPSKEKESITLE